LVARKRRRNYSGNSNEQEASKALITTKNSIPLNLPKFRIGKKDTHSTYAAIKEIENQNPQANFTVQPNLKGEIIIHPKDKDSAMTLDTFLSNNTSIASTKLDPAQRQLKSVILLYSKELPLQPLESHPTILKAERCSLANDKSVTTRQVLITHYGSPPSFIDLKTWGKYEVRPFVPEPLQCYKCQKYGHHQSRCVLKEVCPICAQKHATENCLSKLKQGEKFTPKCANCGDRHHDWDPSCSE